MTASFTAGLWRLADPKISLASMGSIFLGACAAARDGKDFAALIGVAFALLALLPLAPSLGVPAGAWLGAAGLWPAVSAARTLVAFVLLSLGCGIGLLVVD